MAFMAYERRLTGDMEDLRYIGLGYKLLSLLFLLWQQKGRPLNCGWHVSANDLIRKWNSDHSYKTRRLLVDTAPSSKKRLKIIEMLDVYAYTHGNAASGEIWWTPIMLNIRRVLANYETSRLSPEERNAMRDHIQNPQYQDPMKEFLYTSAHKNGWVWGPSGRTNAAFLETEPRRFFKEYF